MTSILAAVVGLGSAAVGGVYFAFSAMIMPALRRVPAADATATMQAINVRAERGPFILVFAGTAIAGAVLGTSALSRLPDTTAALELVAAGLSIGSTVVTVVGNVPRNNRLARNGTPYWATYDGQWTRLNSMRAVLALGAVAALLAVRA